MEVGGGGGGGGGEKKKKKKKRERERERKKKKKKRGGGGDEHYATPVPIASSGTFPRPVADIPGRGKAQLVPVGNEALGGHGHRGGDQRFRHGRGGGKRSRSSARTVNVSKSQRHRKLAAAAIHQRHVNRRAPVVPAPAPGRRHEPGIRAVSQVPSAPRAAGRGSRTLSASPRASRRCCARQAHSRYLGAASAGVSSRIDGAPHSVPRGRIPQLDAHVGASAPCILSPYPAGPSC